MKMKKRILALLLVLVAVLCSACGNSDNSNNATQDSKADATEAETTQKEKDLDEIKADLNANSAKFLDFFGEGYQVTDLELIKRNTKEDSDTVYCTVSLANDAATLVQDFKFSYNYYTTGGWILDEFEPTGEASTIGTDETTETASTLDDAAYIGAYSDEGAMPEALTIEKGEGNNYTIQVTIFRLGSLEDGVGTLDASGMKFTATDPAGNPIKGLITSDGQSATLTITDSTWEYLTNGYTLQYTKSSDATNSNGESNASPYVDSLSDGFLIENQTFCYYDEEIEITVDLYPDNATSGTARFTLREGGDTGFIGFDGQYALASSGLFEVNVDGMEEKITFSVDLISSPSTLLLNLGTYGTFELADREWILQNAG